ncbi:hypothetical protein [Umezawaea beigongshangensis]|uniref:hypothetical protein n=1 Tax=Umezawaea beigongshangensis TaxID=2780383 RepID=UPI0018F12657|nr:hypothetical protein [Umezawaea beigongshangensis]
MGDLPHRVPNDPRFFTADVHVTPDGHARIGGRDHTPEQYAELLRRSGYDGSRPVRLIGCDAGSNDFARRLSRELDAPVIAPTRPAWTDTRGRVYSSDIEIGPDGTRRPKIPPTGQWDTHHPDGTRTSAGDDGYAPGTRDTDRTDHTDPDGARDRARAIDQSIDTNEGLSPKALLDEKVKNAGYREKYYDGPNSQGEYRRKNANQTDLDGDEVPKLREDPPGNFTVATEDFTPVDGDKILPPVKHDATPDQRAAAEDIIERRANSLERAERAESAYQKQKENGGEPTPEVAEERRAAHHDRTERGEELGEHAAGHAARDMFPPEKYDVTPLHGDEKGAGRFDQIYQVYDKETGTSRYVIIEAKGPSAGLGTRRGLDGDSYQQGHPRYVESVIDNMLKKGTPEEKALAPKLAAALDDDELEFHVVKARVNDEGYNGYTRNEFDLT